MLIITGTIAIIAFKVFNFKVTASGLMDSFSQIGNRLFPLLLMSETISTHKRFIVREIKFILLYGVGVTVLNVYLSYLGLKWLDIFSFHPQETTLQVYRMSVAIIINMYDDTGYKMIMTQTYDTGLYKSTRDLTLMNFFSMFLMAYMESDNDIPQVARFDAWETFYNGILVLITSGSIGLAIGIFMTMAQRTFTSLRDNVMGQVMFVFCCCYLCNFLTSIKSFLMSEDLAMLILGITVSLFCRYNLTFPAAETLSFLLQFLAKLCRLAIICIVGITIMPSLTDYKAFLKSLIIMLMVTVIGFLTHSLAFLILKVTGIKKYGMKEFVMIYLSCRTKGPVVFVVALKYLNINVLDDNIVQGYLVISCFVISPLLYVASKYFETNETDEMVLIKMQKKLEEKMNREDKSKFSIVMAYIHEQILCPFMIYDYHRRNENGVMAKLRSIFYVSLRECEVPLINTGKKKSSKAHRSKEDILQIFSKALSKQLNHSDPDHQSKEVSLAENPHH